MFVVLHNKIMLALLNGIRSCILVELILHGSPRSCGFDEVYRRTLNDCTYISLI